MIELGTTSVHYRDTLERLLSFGLSCARRGNIPAATEIYQQVSSLQLVQASDFRRAGALASLIGQHQDAIQLIHTAVGMVPDDCETWTVLGDAYCNSGILEQGIKAYENALDKDPDAVLPGLAQVYDLTGKYDRADKELARVAKFRFSNIRTGNEHRNPEALFFACLPKSAGTSICNAVAQCAGFAHGGIVATTDHDHFPNSRISPKAFLATVQWPVQLHTHVRASYSNLETLTRSGIKRLIVHIRDPRQAFVSYYFHSNNAMGLIRGRHANPEFDKLDDQGRIRWFMEFYYPRFINWIMGWVRLESKISSYPFSLKVTTFENMLKRGQDRIVKEICDFYGIDPVFPPVEQKCRLRRGRADEWRDVIPKSYHTALWEMIPPALVERFGWKP